MGCVERLTSTDDDVVEVAEPADVDSGNAGAAEVSDGLAGSVISVGDDDAEDVGLISSATEDALSLPEDDDAQPEMISATAPISAAGTRRRLEADMTNNPHEPGQARVRPPSAIVWHRRPRAAARIFGVHGRSLASTNRTWHQTGLFIERSLPLGAASPTPATDD